MINNNNKEISHMQNEGAKELTEAPFYQQFVSATQY